MSKTDPEPGISNLRFLTERPKTFRIGGVTDLQAQTPEVMGKTDVPTLVDRVPPAVGRAIHTAMQASPELFGLDERELLRKLKERGHAPNATDNRIRVKFWHEYDVSCDAGEPMSMVTMLTRLCSKQYFYDVYLKRPDKVAWMVCMPTGYENKMREMLEFGMEQLRDILDLPHVDERGKINTKLIELKAKIINMVELREKGAIVQKIEQKTLSISANMDKHLGGVGSELTMKAIDKRIEDLEGRDRSKNAEQKRLSGAGAAKSSSDANEG